MVNSLHTFGLSEQLPGESPDELEFARDAAAPEQGGGASRYLASDAAEPDDPDRVPPDLAMRRAALHPARPP